MTSGPLIVGPSRQQFRFSHRGGAARTISQLADADYRSCELEQAMSSARLETIARGIVHLLTQIITLQQHRLHIYFVAGYGLGEWEFERWCDTPEDLVKERDIAR